MSTTSRLPRRLPQKQRLKSKSPSKSRSNPKLKPKLIDFLKTFKPTSTQPKKHPKPKSKDLTNILSKRETLSRCKSRPKSSLSSTLRKPKDIKCVVHLGDLVTEEDMIMFSDQYEPDMLPTVINFKKSKKGHREYSVGEAATLIQKLWRDYKTRQIVKYYALVCKAMPLTTDPQKTSKKRKSSLNRNSYNSKEVDKNSITQRQRYEANINININLNIDISPINEYIFNTDEGKEMSRSERQSLEQADFEGTTLMEQKDVSSVMGQQHLEEVSRQPIPKVNGDITLKINEDPILKVIQMQKDLLFERYQQQLLFLTSRYNSKKITHQTFETKKNSILQHYQTQRDTLTKSKSQLSFSFLKVPLSLTFPHTSKLHKRNNHSSQSLWLKNQLDDEDTLSLQMDLHYKQQRILTQSQSSLNDIDNIHTSDIESMDEIELDTVRERVDEVQAAVEQVLIDELAVELYLTETFNKALLPFFDLQAIYRYQLIGNKDIEEFIDTILSKFRPNTEDLLKRLNQKINPSAEELLKILRNDDTELEDEFYELVLPEQVFKAFRQWREGSYQQLTFPSCKPPLNPSSLPPHLRLQIQNKQVEAQTRKRKISKFQKQLQAIYYKAVFNCLNQAIIEVKCSCCPINGRSTIGPGQLRVSLIDSNSTVDEARLPQILSKAKEMVLSNLKHICPDLKVTNYQSVYRFQEVLMKQLERELNLTEHRWMSFFDQYLQIAMDVYNSVLQQLFEEATKEIFWLHFRRSS